MRLIPWFVRSTATAVTQTFPTLTLRIAFTTAPGSETPIWTDVSNYMRGTINIRRGRTNELATVSAGTMGLDLDNKTRRFEAEYSGSPDFPNVLPRRKIQLQALFGSLIYTIFTGYIERWPRTRPNAAYSEVQLTCVDAMSVLAQADIYGTFPQEMSGARVNRVLDLIGWPNVDRFVLEGKSEIAAITIEPPGVKALQHLNDVAVSENGVLFAAGDGAITFHDRHRRVRDQGFTAGTFGDTSDDQFPYRDLVPSFDLDEVYNHVQVVTPTITTEARDAASDDAYFTLSLNRQTQLASDVEAQDAATALVSRLANPATRYDSLTIEPQLQASLWHQALGREISDRIDVLERPMGGTSVTRQQHIEGIQHTIGHLGWETTWQLSPADIQSYLVLEHATLGKIDSIARIAY